MDLSKFALNWPAVAALAILCGLLGVLAWKGVVSEQAIMGVIIGAIIPLFTSKPPPPPPAP